MQHFGNDRKRHWTSRRFLLSGAMACLITPYASKADAQRLRGIYGAASAGKFRYSKPNIPKTPPRVRLLYQSNRLGTTLDTFVKSRNTRAVNALSLNDTLARTHLRSALNRSHKAVNKANGWDAHHVVFWDYRHHPTLARAAHGGFNINGVSNGIRLPKGQHIKTHSWLNDPANRKTQLELLNGLAKKKGFSDIHIATIVRNHTRRWKYELTQASPLISSFNREVKKNASSTQLRLMNRFRGAVSDGS